MRPTPVIRLIGWACAAAIALLIAPTVFVMVQSLRGADGGSSVAAYESVLVSARQWRILGVSVLVSGATALAASGVGLGVGLALAKLTGWRARIAWFCTAAPLALPPYARATAWTDMLGPAGLPIPLAPGYGPAHIASVVLLLSLAWYPIAAVAVALTLPRTGQRGREAALLYCGSHRVFWRITVPQLLPAVGTAASVIAVLALTTFDIPALLQVNTYPVEIYTQFMLDYDMRSGAAQAMPLVALGLGLLMVWRAIIVRPWAAHLESGSNARTASRQGRFLIPPILSAGVAAALPMGYLVYRTRSWAIYQEVWSTAQEAIATSLFIAALTATVTVALALATAWSLRYGSGAARIYVVAFAAFLLSGPVAGIGLIAFWNRPGFAGAVYDSVWIVVLAIAMRYFFFVAQAMCAAVGLLPRRLDEAALVSGVSQRRVFTGIGLPLLAPLFSGIWCFAFLFAFNEIDATVLVCPPGLQTFPVRLYSLFHYGPGDLVAGFAVVGAIVSLAVLCAGVLAFNHARARLHGLR